MPSPNDAPGPRILGYWRRLSGFPGGVWLFNRLLARLVPYTGALGARVERLEPGAAEVTLPDRRGVRNHLKSIHAVALANLAEVTSGLAMLTALPPGVRGIVVRIEVDYLRKARGTIRAEARVELPEITGPMQVHPEASLFDAGKVLVARARVTWNVSPTDQAPSRPPAELTAAHPG
jgi:uncharacterized protein (TIGR00369 family)